MNGVNLIPAARLRARARRAQARLWSAAIVACALALAGAHAGLRSMWMGTADLRADSEKVAKELACAQKADKSARAMVKEARAAADAAREIADQPDWGVLLSFVADKLGSEAALDSFHLERPSKTVPEPAPKSPAAKPAAQPSGGRGYTLVLTGVAATQDAASDVAIELRRTDLFAAVTLVETHRITFKSSPAVGFKIDCVIAGAGGAD